MCASHVYACMCMCVDKDGESVPEYLLFAQYLILQYLFYSREIFILMGLWLFLCTCQVLNFNELVVTLIYLSEVGLCPSQFVRTW